MESPTCEDSTSSGSAGDGSELGRIHGRAEVQYLHLWAMEVEEEREGGVLYVHTDFATE